MSRRDEILDVAVTVLEEKGPDALTMRELATRMGMRAPSLYKHETRTTSSPASRRAP